MRPEKTTYRPIKFVDRMEGNNHIVLLYDDQKYADLVIARYISNGLEKGESCIFFTSSAATAEEPDTIEKMLSAQGVDFDYYKRKNALRIYHTERPDEDNNKVDILRTLKTIRKEATRDMKPPCRFVGRTISDTETIEGMKMGLAVERTGHDHFEDFDCSQMCYYRISEIEKSSRHEWIRALLKNHHYVIYASEPERAVAFETTLLESAK
jgi:hypothetical protein